MHTGSSLLCILGHLLPRSYTSVSIHFPYILYSRRNFQALEPRQIGLEQLFFCGDFGKLMRSSRRAVRKQKFFSLSAQFPKIQQPRSQRERSVQWLIVRPISGPSISSGFIAILNRTLISLAQPGCWGREWRVAGLLAKGIFLQILWSPSSLLRKKWIILSPAPSWSPELNSLLCFGLKAGRRPLQFESQRACILSVFRASILGGGLDPKLEIPAPKMCFCFNVLSSKLSLDALFPSETTLKMRTPSHFRHPPSPAGHVFGQ